MAIMQPPSGPMWGPQNPIGNNPGLGSNLATALSPTAGGGTGAPTGTPLPGGASPNQNPGNPLGNMPYASNFGGPSNDPNAFTTGSYSHDLNQNSLAWAGQMGDTNSNNTLANFNNAWNQTTKGSQDGIWDPSIGYGGGGPSSWDSPLAKYEQSLGNVTANEQANHSSQLWQTPQVTAGQPYNHFMQGLNFGNGTQQNPGNNTPTGYNNWNPSALGGGNNGAGVTPPQQAQGQGQIPGMGQPPGSGPLGGGQGQGGQQGYGGGAYGGFQPPSGMAQGQSGSSPGQGGFNPAQGNYNWSTPVAGGYNQWGNPLMGNPYSYMTGQPNNGLGGGTVYSGSQPGSPNMWSPFGANMAQGYQNTNGTMPNPNFGFTNQSVPANGAQGASNPLGGAGNMGNFSQLMNAIMGMFGGI